MFFANQVALLLGSFAFVWAKLFYMDPRTTDWSWYDKGVTSMPNIFALPRWLFGPVWAVLDVLMALFGYFAFAAYTASKSEDCDALFIPCVVLYVVTVLACKLYSLVYFGMGSRVGGLVMSILIAATAVPLMIIYAVFWNSSQYQCLPSDLNGYGTVAFIFVLFYTLWTLYAFAIQLLWHVNGLPSPSGPLARTVTSGDGDATSVESRYIGAAMSTASVRKSLLK